MNDKTRSNSNNLPLMSSNRIFNPMKAMSRWSIRFVPVPTIHIVAINPLNGIPTGSNYGQEAMLEQESAYKARKDEREQCKFGRPLKDQQDDFSE